MSYPPIRSSCGDRGSVLLIIVGILTVLMVAGLAYSARSISTQKQSSHSIQSDQAYACAEAGAEEALGILEGGDVLGCSSEGSPCAGSLTDPASPTTELCHFNYYATDDPPAGAGSYDFVLGQDDTIQLTLTGGGNITLYWYGSGVDEGDPAALLYSAIYYDGADYQMDKAIYDPTPLLRPPDTGFDSNVSASDEADYDYMKTIAIPDGNGRPVLLRVRGLFASNQAMIKDSGLTSQGTRVTSTGYAGESVRRVEVRRSNPYLPTIFDYVLFSGSSTIPLQK